MKTPGSWNGAKIEGYDNKIESTGYATYRMFIKNPNRIELTHFKLRSIFSSCIIFINGDIVFQAGIPNKNVENTMPDLVANIVNIGKKTGDLEIVIHVSNNFLFKGGIINSPKIGLEKVAYTEREKSVYWDLFLFGSLLIMSIYHLGLFISRKEDYSTLYFSLFSLMFAIRPLLTGERVVNRFFSFFHLRC